MPKPKPGSFKRQKQLKKSKGIKGVKSREEARAFGAAQMNKKLKEMSNKRKRKQKSKSDKAIRYKKQHI